MKILKWVLGAIWRLLRGAIRRLPIIVFLMGLGFIVATVSGPRTGANVRQGGLMFLQAFYGKTATGNWFPDRFKNSGVLRYDPARAQPGYTLYTLTPDLSAHLIDMNGHEVKRWSVPKDKAIPEANSARTLFGLMEPQVEGGHLFPNGDVIMVYEVKSLTFPATPLVKLDKNSNILWLSKVQSHHAMEVVGDKIYALTADSNPPPPQPPPPPPPPGSPPPSHPYFPPTAFNGENVTVLDSDGNLLSTHSIGEAMGNAKDTRLFDELTLGSFSDALHSNSIDVLTQQNAHFIPGAKPGDVLLSLRNQDMLAVMDLENDKIIWALRGGWRKQHDAKMLSNGHILLFDNEGGLMKHSRSRVLEVDPSDGAIVWSYEGTEDDPLDSGDNRGGAQRLPNGNTLINESNAGRLLEVTPDGSVVWEFVNHLQTEERGQRIIASFGLTATRYEPASVPFLGSEKP